MFEEIRRSLRDRLASHLTPDARRSLLAEMKDTLVRARLGLEDLRRGLDESRARLAAEERELETVRRRKALAEGIGDAETVAVAERFERQHLERVEVLRRKVDAQEAELALTDRELHEMTQELKGATLGVGASTAAGAGGAPDPGGGAGAPADPLEDDAAALRGEFDSLARERTRAARDADVEARLDALKKKMGR